MSAQVNNLDVKALQDEISRYEKSGDNYSNDYANLINTLSIKYFKNNEFNKAEILALKVTEINKKNLGEKNLEYVSSLIYLAIIYKTEGKYSDAESMYLKVINIQKGILGENNNDYAISLNCLAILYYDEGKFIQAETLFLKTLDIQKNILGENSSDYAVTLNGLAVLYDGQGKYDKAENTYNKVLNIQKEILGEKHPDYANTLNNLAGLYVVQSKFKEAESLYLKVLEVKKEILGEKNPHYAKSLYDLAIMYENQGKYKEAELTYTKALVIQKEILGENNLDYATSINGLARLYSNQGKLKDAEFLYLKALEIFKKILGNKDTNYAATLNGIATLNVRQGKYKEAEPLFLEALNIQKEILGEKHLVYVTSLNNLSTLYLYQGRFKKAEVLYLKILEIRKEILGEKHPDYANSLNGLALVYENLGKYKEAEQFYIKALNIEKEIQGDRGPDYLNVLSNLGVLYDIQGKYKEAEPLYLETLESRKLVLGENHPDFAISLNNLATLYQHLGKNNLAESIYLQLLDIQKEILGENHPFYATTLNNLAVLYENIGRNQEAEHLFLNALEIKKEILGENHSDYISILYDIARFYQHLNSNDKSSLYFKQFTEKNKVKTLDDIFGLNENELFSYLDFKNNFFVKPLSFLYNFPNIYKDINISCFENELLIKNISLRNHEIINKSINKEGNKLLQKKYKMLVDNKKQITKLFELPVNQRPENFQTLIKETGKIENQLIKESSTFSDYKKGITISFNDLKSQLKKEEEVVIDLIAFKYYNKTSTDSTVYAAFIVKKDSKFPKFISLFDEKQLDFLLSKNKIQQDNSRIDKQYKDNAICDLFFKPLEKELEGVTAIYLSPSGLGHQIDFAALPIKDTQTFGEKYKLHILSSPSELMNYKVASLEKKSKIEFLLYGGIDYTKSNGNSSLNVDDNSISFNEDFINFAKRSGFEKLPGTLKEVDGINANANKSGFSSKVFKESEATEESIKVLDGKTTPYVLHLATHGFFFPQPIQEIPNDILSSVGKSKIYKTSNDPMMRSGLLLAGAKNYWGKSNQNNTIEDGILTASEISNLDLSACQLVVLSACETGLGVVKGSEGVFGLQRAFKMAGVKNIIMSLWKVPDAQTAELFDIFYSECFAGKTIHEAFRSAQAKMKAKYFPYYWAGFVLLE